MPARKYSDSLLDRAAAMRDEGHSYTAISQRLEISYGAVYWHCLRLGADSPRAQRSREHAPGPRVVSRGNHQVRRFTDDEDRRLLAMELDGETVSAIARALGRKPNSITGRLMTLARREARREVKG